MVDSNILLIAKALFIIVIGVFAGYILKVLIKKLMDKLILKKIFKKDLSAYETSTIIVRIFAEIIQWTIILLLANYALVMLNFDLLSRVSSFIISEIPRISLFLGIIAAGLIISKLISSRIKNKGITNAEEISFVTELIIIAAFTLTALEFIGIKATALIELFKAILYAVVIILVILIIRPDILKSQPKPKKRN